MASSPGRGVRLDYRIIANRMSQLMRLIVDAGSLSEVKTKSTQLLANMTSVDTYIQATSALTDLPSEQSIAGSSDDALL